MCYSCVTPDWTLQVQADLAAAQAEAAKFNSRETLFELELTDYSRIKKMGDQFDPFFQFWNTAANWKKWQKSWMMDPFIELDSEQELLYYVVYILLHYVVLWGGERTLAVVGTGGPIERDVSASYKTMFKMGKAFQLRDFGKCADNCEKVRVEVEAFKQYTPLITALRSPGMRERHWQKITADIGESTN
eukprot:9466939-Pyramimonas_sp.AAC.2